MVKSTWPGVSMMFRRLSRQKQVVAAEVIVMLLVAFGLMIYGFLMAANPNAS